MLAWLRIQDLVLVHALELELCPGFNVLTGETGAGKSLVLQGLQLLAGARAGSGVVRTGARTAVVEAVLDASRLPDLQDYLRGAGLECPDPAEVVLRREVAAGGRGKCFVNGRAATTGQLADVARRALEISGQHGQLALAEPAAQRALLDGAAGASELAAEVATAAGAWAAAAQRLRALRGGAGDAALRADFLSYVVRELEEALPEEGEVEALLAEEKRLGSVDKIARGVGGAVAALGDNPDGEPTAVDLLAAAADALASVEDADEALRPLEELVAGALASAEEAHRALAKYLARLEAEPDRLAEVKGRLAAIRALQRKHRVASAEELRELHAAKKAELEELLGREEREAEAAREVARRAAVWREAAGKLTRAREAARGKLARELEKALRRLDLPHARAEWELLPLPEAADEGPPTGASHGAEQPRLLFSANPGEPPRPVGEVASGGELSRLLLACLRRGGGGAGTLVLDEVDAGLSGRAAKAVGEELRSLGEQRQVLCISHQAAIAARAHRHFLIEKASRGGATATSVELLDAAGRREEVARLLDGAQSGKARELAEELLLKAG